MATNEYMPLSSRVLFCRTALFLTWSGPYEGKRHDSTTLYESGVLPNLRRVAFYNEPLCDYGDPAYPLGVHLQGPFKDRQLTPQMQAYNTGMSEVRVAVEWMFGNITNSSVLLTLKRQVKINLGAVGEMYFICALLENARTCLYAVTLFQPLLIFHHL